MYKRMLNNGSYEYLYTKTQAVPIHIMLETASKKVGLLEI
jgi:hypothetical protein